MDNAEDPLIHIVRTQQGAQTQQCYRQPEDSGQNCREEQEKLLHNREEKERKHGIKMHRKFPRNLPEKRVDKEQSYGWVRICRPYWRYGRYSSGN